MNERSGCATRFRARTYPKIHTSFTPKKYALEAELIAGDIDAGRPPRSQQYSAAAKCRKASLGRLFLRSIRPVVRGKKSWS